MKHPWFRPYGWIYWPTSWQGWLVTVLADLFVLHILLIAALRTHSVSDAFYMSFPYVVPTILLWNWVASKKSS